MAGLTRAEGHPAWVERLAFWAAPELRSLRQDLARMDRELAALPAIANLNSGNRTGFQSTAKLPGEDLWVELELPTPQPVDQIVLVPLLARGSSGQVPGFGFPRRFLLEGTDADGGTVLLMDETGADFPHPGPWPVSTLCPPDTVLQQIRLTATGLHEDEGPAVLALAEIMVLQGPRNLAGKARVRSSSSREIPPTWSRNNLTDMMTPLGLPLEPGGSKVLGWHGPESTATDQTQTVTVDLGRSFPLDEIRLIPAWRSPMVWESYYGFPIRFKVESCTEPGFRHPDLIHDRTGSSLLSPGQNLQCYDAGGVTARYIRITTSRLRDHSSGYSFALGELQAYSGGQNTARLAGVQAEGSWETVEWSRAGLTDGAAGGGTLLELPDWIRKLDQRRRTETARDGQLRRYGEKFRQAEQSLVATSVFGAGGIVALAGLFTWRAHRQRGLDQERHRERLARDLHDELGSNLGSIALISSFAAQEEESQMRQDLAEIERVARESADSMRDMVSLLAGRRGGTTADWLQVMSGLAERLMRGATLECRLPAAPLIWEPHLETRRELYLFCKEVLYNAARHAQPSRVEFHLTPLPDGLRIMISDNGKGFDPQHVISGHGLGNLRERAGMLRASMSLTSVPGKGTRVCLDVPRTRRWTKR